VRGCSCALLRVHTHDACLAHEPPGHPERPDRLVAARRGVAESGVSHESVLAPAVDLALVERVHAPAHVAFVRDACVRGPTFIDADTFAAPPSWDAALRAAGAAVAAARDAERGSRAFALVRPPGHHATRASAMGFCLLNNVAVAAHDLTERGLRVAIVDVDVHHGNGTQDVVWRREDVLYASLHGWPLYPGTGAASETGAFGNVVNVPLAAGSGPGAWLAAFDARVVPALARFAPDVVLASVGFDADARDPLGNLALDPATFGAAVRRLREACPRVACVLEGGYDLDAVREGAAVVARALA